MHCAHGCLRVTAPTSESSALKRSLHAEPEALIGSVMDELGSLPGKGVYNLRAPLVDVCLSPASSGAAAVLAHS